MKWGPPRRLRLHRVRHGRMTEGRELSRAPSGQKWRAVEVWRRRQRPGVLVPVPATDTGVEPKLKSPVPQLVPCRVSLDAPAHGPSFLYPFGAGLMDLEAGATRTLLHHAGTPTPSSFSFTSPSPRQTSRLAPRFPSRASTRPRQHHHHHHHCRANRLPPAIFPGDLHWAPRSPVPERVLGSFGGCV